MPPGAFPLPAVGDIVYCRFPESVGNPGPKPRPALVVALGRFADGSPAVKVAYGTSEKTRQLYSGEFIIAPQDGAAYRDSGLSYPTKFDLGNVATLPYTDEWFRIPPSPLFGQTPKLGVLHPSLVRRAQTAFDAVANPKPR